MLRKSCGRRWRWQASYWNELPLLQGAVSSVIIRSISSKDKWANLSRLFWIKGFRVCEICQNYQAMLTTEPLDTANIIDADPDPAEVATLTLLRRQLRSTGSQDVA